MFYYGWICITFSIVMPSRAINGVVLLADFLPPSRPELQSVEIIEGRQSQ